MEIILSLLIKLGNFLLRMQITSTGLRVLVNLLQVVVMTDRYDMTEKLFKALLFGWKIV